MERPNEATPAHLRDGVKAGIFASIKDDVEHRGGRTARILVTAGVLGAFGSVGVTLIVSPTHSDTTPGGMSQSSARFGRGD